MFENRQKMSHFLNLVKLDIFGDFQSTHVIGSGGFSGGRCGYGYTTSSTYRRLAVIFG